MQRLWALVVVGSMSLIGCGDSTETARDTIDGAPALAADAADRDSAVTGDDAASGASPDADAHGPADASGADARSAGMGDAGADGAVREGGVMPGATTRAPELRIYSDTATIEFTPALFAARTLYPGTATVLTGGIANLFNPGQADLATNAETQALRQSVQHPNLRIVFTVTETFYRIIARRSANLARLADLRQKRVGTVPNTSAHYYLDRMLRTVGLSDTDVTIVSAFPLTRLASMLQGGQVDAVTSWEPEPQNAADALGSDAIEFQDRSVYREIVNLHTTAEKLADPEKRRGIVAFVKALMDAADTFQNRPEQVWPLVSEATGYAPALLSKVWHLERFPGDLTSDLLDVLETEEAWVAQKANRAARSRAQLESLIDDSVLKEALSVP